MKEILLSNKDKEIKEYTLVSDIDYEYLKQFYNQIIDAHSQQIILKKMAGKPKKILCLAPPLPKVIMMISLITKR